MRLRNWKNGLKTVTIVHSIKEKCEVAHRENSNYCKTLMRTGPQRAWEKNERCH